ncbi:MAG: hypothetical protein V3U09_07160 [Thermoplasmata archaeon]
MDQIIAGEGSKARGYTCFISGAIVVSIIFTFAYAFAGFSHVTSAAMIFVMALSLLTFFILLGLAEIHSQVRYFKYALLAIYIPFTPLVIILAIGTMDRVFLLLLFFLLVSVLMNYLTVWRRISKAEGGDLRG